MDANTHYKICPRCQQQAQLNAPTCSKCGRHFSTKFAGDKTQSAPSPAPSLKIPNPPPLPPLPTPGPARALGTQSIKSVTWDEYVHQWVMLNWYLAWGCIAFLFGMGGVLFFLLSAVSVVGVVLFIYAIMQRHALRRKVAEAGEDPTLLAREGDAAFFVGFRKLLMAICAAGVLFGLLLTVGAYALGLQKRYAEAQLLNSRGTMRELSTTIYGWRRDYLLEKYGRPDIAGTEEAGFQDADSVWAYRCTDGTLTLRMQYGIVNGFRESPK